jgi:DNA-binding transcriptional MerR regulator
VPQLAIGRVAAEMRLRASAIRYYEAEGLLPPPRRSSGRRVYDVSTLDRLALIELAKECGFSIAEIRNLLQGFGGKASPAGRWRTMARAKLEELDQKMDQITRMKRVLKAISRCECRTIEECGIRARRHSSRA